jgi:hypothetical protein
MNALDSFVPIQVKQTAEQSGNEFLYPYPVVLEVVRIATEKNISILGVEIFHALSNGLLTEAMTSYEVPFNGDWDDFVRKNNALAADFIDQHRRGEEHGYILSATSQEEFRKLK